MHEARKDLKKLRALLRMTRGELGDATFRRENLCFRDAGRELAGVRESDVMLDTLRTLDLPAGVEYELRTAIQATARGTAATCAARPPTGVVAMLTRGARACRGLATGARLVRCAAQGARAHIPPRTPGLPGGSGAPTVEALHEWRKRVKDLWYQHTLLRELWPPVMQAVGRRGAPTRRPARRRPRPCDARGLGARARARRSPSSSRRWRRRRSELQVEAMALGERLYADKPGLVRRLRRLWNTAQTSVRAP